MTRSTYYRRYSQLFAQKMGAAERFAEIAPADVPRDLRAPYLASEWLKLSPEERRNHMREIAKKEIVAALGPRPSRTGKRPSLSLSELERLVIERAENHAADLRFILNGTPEHVEAIVVSQLPALRAKVFDDLTDKYQIIEG